MNEVISINPNVCHGQPCFKGTRIMVWQILELLEGGLTIKEITSAKYFPQLSKKHVGAALHFAAEQMKNRNFIAFEKQAS